jgi:hypothetical protein
VEFPAGGCGLTAGTDQSWQGTDGNPQPCRSPFGGCQESSRDGSSPFRRLAHGVSVVAVVAIAPRNQRPKDAGIRNHVLNVRRDGP